MDLGKEAVRVEGEDDPFLLDRPSIESGRFTVAVRDTTEGIELGVVGEAERAIEESAPKDRVALSRLHAQFLACQPTRGDLRVVRGPVGEEDGALIRIRAVRPPTVQVFAGDVEVAAFADVEAEVGVGLHLLAVARACHARLNVADQRVGLTLENDVDDTRDGVRAILRRGAISQHLDPLNRRRRDRVQVDTDGAAAERPIHVR